VYQLTTCYIAAQQDTSLNLWFPHS